MPDTTFLFEPGDDAARPRPSRAALTARTPGPRLADRVLALWHRQGDRATPLEDLLGRGAALVRQAAVGFALREFRLRPGAAPADWAAIALAAGYSDQPHLVREFGELAGLTPVAWQRAWRAHGATGKESSRRRDAAGASIDG